MALPTIVPLPSKKKMPARPYCRFVGQLGGRVWGAFGLGAFGFSDAIFPRFELHTHAVGLLVIVGGSYELVYIRKGLLFCHWFAVPSVYLDEVGDQFGK